MNKMIRSISSTLGKALLVCAFALFTIIVSVVFDLQESTDAEHDHRRQHGELTFTSLDFPGSTFTAAFDINDRGQIVSTYVDPDGGTASGFTHGFLFEDGIFSTIDVPGPGPSETELTGISNSGEIAGVYRDALGSTHGVLLDKKGNFTTINAPEAVETAFLRGQIIGGSADARGTTSSF